MVSGNTRCSLQLIILLQWPIATGSDCNTRSDSWHLTLLAGVEERIVQECTKRAGPSTFIDVVTARKHKKRVILRLICNLLLVFSSAFACDSHKTIPSTASYTSSFALSLPSVAVPHAIVAAGSFETSTPQLQRGNA